MTKKLHRHQLSVDAADSSPTRPLPRAEIQHSAGYSPQSHVNNPSSSGAEKPQHQTTRTRESAVDLHPASTAPRQLSVRTRFILWALAIAGFTLLIAGAVNYVLSRQALETRLDDSLIQMVQEVEFLVAEGIDNDTQQQFSAANALTFTAMQTAQHSTDQGMVTLQNGEVAWTAPENVYLRLEEDDEFISWAKQVPNDAVYLTTTTTQDTDYRVAVVPVQLAEDTSPATLLVAYDVGAELQQLNVATLAFSGAGLAALAIGAVTAWLAVGRMMRPVRQLRNTAQHITEHDLGTRVPVTGDDEFAELTETINDMLDRLETSVDAQRQLLDDVGHELRTPITIIRGHLELTDPEDPAEVAETKEVALDELDRMSLLVNDLVTLAQANRTDFVSPKPTNIDQLIASVRNRATGLGEQNFVMQADAEADTVVTLDPHRISQALLQLCANAVKFSPADSTITLGYALHAPESLNPQVVLWVQDEGRGIPADQVEEIFTRFHRGDDVERIDGSGLGLSIVKAIATAHGATVYVDSTEGVGSTFSIGIPIPWDEQNIDSRGDTGATHSGG